MLWYCRFTWNSHTTREAIAQRIVQQDEAGANHPERIKGWYNLAGGGGGFLLVETDQPQELTAFLQPYMDLVSFDVRAAYALDYNEVINNLQNVSSYKPRYTGGGVPKKPA